jgi:hypothetical protein
MLEVSLNPREMCTSMKRRRLARTGRQVVVRGLISALLLGALPFAAFCENETTGQPVRLPFDPEEVRFATDWYGVYFGDQKVGALGASMKRKGRKDRKRIVFSMEGEMKVVALGEKMQMRMTEVLEFSFQAPFRLLNGESTMVQGKFSQRVSLEATGDVYRVTVHGGGEERVLTLDDLDYTLADVVAPEFWARGDLKVGDRLVVRSFSLDDLETDLETYEIREMRSAVTGGVRSRFYEMLLSSDTHGEVGLARVDSEGRLLSAVIAGDLEMRLEPKRLAKDFGYSGDLFVMGMLPVDRPLGDLATITGLVVEVSPELAALLEDGPRQSLVHQEESGLIELRVGREHGIPQKPTEEEVRENLEETLEYPIDHPRIQALLGDAIGKAEGRREQVEALVGFVHEYLEQDYSAEPLTIFDVLNERKGDCTEYSLLFTTLARAAGIPARTVSGLLYMGDDVQSFGGHAWNEVVLDGAWVPVDAAWNEVEINAAHITFPDTMKAEAGYVTVEKRPLVVKDVRRRDEGGEE